MTRSLRRSSRSYPGRPDRRVVQLTLDSVLHGNMEDVHNQESAEAIVGAGRRQRSTGGWVELGE